MTGTEGGPATGLRDVIARHGVDLRRTALMLTGDPESAQALLARVVDRTARRAPERADLDGVTADLVRSWARSARARGRRHRDGLPHTGAASDVLASLSPRARAATVLRLGLGWEAGRAAQALRIDATRVAQLVPDDPRLEAALAALGDLETEWPSEPLPVPETGRAPGPRPRRWPWPGSGRWVAAAAVLLVVLYAVSSPASPDSPDGTGQVAAEGSSHALQGGTDQPAELEGFNERGWVITEGRPPRVIDGLLLMESAQVTFAGEQAFELHRDARANDNRWAVLWCEIPPVDDPGLDVPEAQVAIAGQTLTVPCAGKDGVPAVQRLTSLPPQSRGEGAREVRLTWTGTTPRQGYALFAVYHEASTDPVPHDGSATAPRPPGPGVVLDPATEPLEMAEFTWGGTDHEGPRTRHVQIDHDSTITAWLGGPATLAIAVDGISVTTDGDQVETVTPFAWSVEGPTSGVWAEPSAQDQHAWQRQDPELRDGVWHSHRSENLRTFEIPERLRPSPGQHRVVAVEVSVGAGVPWWVEVSGVPADQDPAQPIIAQPPDPGRPEFIQGLQAVASWEVPRDGRSHPLRLPEAVSGERGLVFEAEADDWGEPTVYSRDIGIVTARPAGVARAASDGDGDVEQTAVVWVQPPAPSASGDPMLRLWALHRSSLAQPGDALVAGAEFTATVPSYPDSPMVRLTGYRLVSFEEFDHTGAPEPYEALPPDVVAYWAGETIDEISAEDLRDGRAQLGGESTGMLLLRVSTEGAGRLRVSNADPVSSWQPFLGDGGWWTPWTDQPVRMELFLHYLESAEPVEILLDLEVEGFSEGFRVELAHMGP